MDMVEDQIFLMDIINGLIISPMYEFEENNASS